jgi:hypothetical protein
MTLPGGERVSLKLAERGTCVGDKNGTQTRTRLVCQSIRPLDRIRAITSSPRSPIHSLSVGGLPDEGLRQPEIICRFPHPLFFAVRSSCLDAHPHSV